MRQRWWLGLWAIGLALSGASTRAQAQMCETDSQCEKGFNCQVTAAGTCPAVACAPGEKCMEPVCEPVTYRECRPAPCSSDTDCADGMVCYASPVTCGGDIAVAPCPPGQTCPEVKPTCPEPTRMCTPRYVLPCQEASDCGGAGWECKAVEECSCSGSSGSATPGSEPMASGAPTPAPDAGTASGAGGKDAPTPEQDAGVAKGASTPDPTCECHLSDQKQCQVIAKDCMADSDCPAEFVCHLEVAPQAASGSCSVSRDGGMEVCVQDPLPPPPMTTVGECWPKYGDAAKSGSNGGVTLGTSAPERGSGSSGPSTQPNAPPTDPGTGGHVAASDNAHGADAGVGDESSPMDATPKCSVSSVGSTSSSGSAFAWFTAAIALAWLRRRRQS